MIFIVAMMFLSIEAPAQKKKFKGPKDPQKEAIKKEESEERQFDKDIKKAKKEHRKLQGKKTSKRMKSNRKRSTRHAYNKKDPFFQRVFRRKKDKKVKRED